MSDLPPDFINQLTAHLRQKALDYASSDVDQLLVFSGVMLNWIADYVLDSSATWQLQTIAIDDLYLTGTSPDWNRVVVDQAERSPAKLRQLMAQDQSVNTMFAECQFIDMPILVRQEDEHLKVLDGMHRTLAAIRDGHGEIQAYIGTRTGRPAPIVEAHVVYDLLRAYRQQGGNLDDLIAGLRFLMQHYHNVAELLQGRLKREWESDSDLALRIQTLLDQPR